MRANFRHPGAAGPCLAGVVVLLLCHPIHMSCALGADKAPGLEFFEKSVRPILVEHCYKCHSAQAQQDKKLKGGLRLDTKEGLLKGGDSGPAVIPGKPADSLLLKG